MTKENIIRQAYEAAVERYAAVGVDAREAMDKLQKISLSMHCWQADDVSGFENQGGLLTGGIQVTGNYPGRARTIDEVRADVLKAASLIAGKHRLNLHEIYGDFQGRKVERERDEAGFQQHFFFASEERRPDVGESRRCDPQFLDRTYETLPLDQRGDGQIPGRSLYYEPVDSRRQ